MSAGEREAPRFFPIAASFYLALAVAGVIGLGLAHGRLGAELLFDPGSWWTDIGLGLGAGALLIGLWELARRLTTGARRVEAELGRLIGELSAGEAAAIAVISAIGEEVAFRGAFQTWIGWIPSALLFGLLHLGPGKHFRWWSLWALVGGLGLGLMVDQRGSLGAAILAHLVVNGVQLQRLRAGELEPEAEEPEAEEPGAGSPEPAGEPEPDAGKGEARAGSDPDSDAEDDRRAGSAAEPGDDDERRDRTTSP